MQRISVITHSMAVESGGLVEDAGAIPLDLTAGSCWPNADLRKHPVSLDASSHAAVLDLSSGILCWFVSEFSAPPSYTLAPSLGHRIQAACACPSRTFGVHLGLLYPAQSLIVVGFRTLLSKCCSGQDPLTN